MLDTSVSIWQSLPSITCQMNSGFFNTDYASLALEFLRPKHRSSNQSTFMAALHFPLKHLNTLFFRFRESVFYQLAHDSRKISIEKVLNDKFDPSSRRIYIENVQPKPQNYLYEKGDEKPLYLYEPEDDQPVYLEDLNSLELSSVNFTVFLPNAIKSTGASMEPNQKLAINTQVNNYKLAGKNHNLQWID